MVNVTLAIFAVAYFWSLSDIHEPLGQLQKAPYPLDKQTPGCQTPHDWLMRLAVDLAALCDMWR